MHFLYGTFLLLSLSLTAVAQQPLEVYYEKDNQNTYTFYCRNNDVSNYALTVAFTTLSNLQTNVQLPYRGTVRSGVNLLFRLQEQQKGGPTTFQYSIRYVPGCLNPKVDTTVAYLMPVAPGRQSTISELTYIGKQFAGESEPKDWYSVRFAMNAGDTVFVARRGVVVSLRDDAHVTGTNATFRRDDNFVRIQHGDCSFATYTVFKDKGLFVKTGQSVEAGDPLGIVGGESYAGGPHVRFSVHYNYEAPVQRNGQPSDRMHYWAYVPVRFHTTDGPAQKLTNHRAYTAARTEALITQEMSKREVKNWKKRQTGQ